jgi:hypothetical protein
MAYSYRIASVIANAMAVQARHQHFFKPNY